MNAADEILDVVDDHDRVIDQATRDEIHARNLKHRAVHVFLFNERGELFVQKRARSKDTFPGCYDSSAAGHVNRGEDYDACAVRELKEELGLEISGRHLHKLFNVTACRETGWEFVRVYNLQGDCKPAPDPAEIEEGAYWPLERVGSLVADYPEKCASSFVFIVREFQTRGLFPRPD